MDAKGNNMICRLKGRMDNGGHYDVEMNGWMQKGGIMMCKLKEWMDNAGHYVKIKGWIQSGHYDVQMKRADR